MNNFKWSFCSSFGIARMPKSFNLNFYCLFSSRRQPINWWKFFFCLPSHTHAKCVLHTLCYEEGIKDESLGKFYIPHISSTISFFGFQLSFGSWISHEICMMISRMQITIFYLYWGKIYNILRYVAFGIKNSCWNFLRRKVFTLSYLIPLGVICEIKVLHLNWKFSLEAGKKAIKNVSSSF